MSLVKSDLFPDPNPLAQPAPSDKWALAVVEPPKVTASNPLSVAQYNGFVEGAVLGGSTGFVLGIGAGLLAFWLVQRYAR